MILDEATANIDVKTEMRILESIFSEFRDKTIIFVSHRLSSASLADNVLIIDSGQIVESGAPEELFALNGAYYRMCEQSKVRGAHEEAVAVAS